jgi:UDP-N-acetylmuramoyl-L-alanyl-D-glutamate--2,6-diaminopimelate ligase
MSSRSSALTPVAEFHKSLSELASFVGDQDFNGSESFSGITINSRTVKPGDLFIALPGAKVHGASFAQAVIASGAVAVLTDAEGALLVGSEIPVLVVAQPRSWVGPISAWFYRNPFGSLDAIGLTGTNGKTTTASLIDQIWRLDGRSTGFIGTIGISIDGEEFAASHTTPEGSDLQEMVATMRERHVRNLVMEVSSHALSMRRVSGARFTTVGFTNLTQDHLDFHGDMESYFQAKALLFTPEFTESAVVNIDDPHGLRLFNEAKVPTKSLSRSSHKADWYFDSFTFSSAGNGYEVAIRGSGGILIEGLLPLLGLHNLDNALLAIALAVESGVDPIALAYYMRRLSAPVGRLEPVEVGQKFLALVDYAHTPDAVSRALSTARTLTSGRVIAVLGCGGDRDRTKRPIMGRALREGADLAVFTSDNPRSEDPELILREMVDGVESDKQIIEPDRRAAIATAVLEAEPGDCVIVLGKGHERGQEISGVKHPFDDRIELARAIEELS